MPHVTANTLRNAIEDLKGTANHMLKIWFVLKQMGMTAENPVMVDTGNSTPALEELFGYGNPDGGYFIPFSHTKRFMTMKGDASRSIIQTNLVRWAESGSVVTVDPTDYLDIQKTEGEAVKAKPGRSYPQGLGQGEDGFALEDGTRVTMPLTAFGVWYYRQKEVPDNPDEQFFRSALKEDLNLTTGEIQNIFVSHDPSWEVETQPMPLADEEVYSVVSDAIEEGSDKAEVIEQSMEDHITNVKTRVTTAEGKPNWIFSDPQERLRDVLDRDSKAVLLYGPPRTGKTRACLQLLDGEDSERIQIHEGWGYDDLIVGLRPQPEGGWEYKSGPLRKAIEEGKDYIVLEEINRTDFSQAIGEVFSLIEEAYRGPSNGISLKDGEDFFIPEDTVILCTMNTLDRSTENIDDALFGRMDAVEFPPRVEELSSILSERGITNVDPWLKLFTVIQDYHPIGHGYFAPLTPDVSPVEFYMTRIRPILQKHLEGYRGEELDAIDEKVDQLFGK